MRNNQHNSPDNVKGMVIYMHEYPLTLQIVSTAEQHAKENGAQSVKAVNLVVGDYSGCVADCIAMYFDIIAEDSMCANAELNIERVKPMLRCKKCGELFERKPFSFNCDHDGCSGEGEPTDIGREFYIKSIEI